MTNNSLAASQRPYISLIDRRHSSARRVPYRVRSTPPCHAGRTPLALLTGASHINVEATGARPMTVAMHCRSRASGALPGWASQRVPVLLEGVGFFLKSPPVKIVPLRCGPGPGKSDSEIPADRVGHAVGRSLEQKSS